MSAEKDVAHGSVTMYRRGCRCADCTRGAATYEQQRQLDILRGRPRRVPILGSQRRLQALVALGYDWRSLGRELGVTDTMVWQWATQRTWMFRETAERVAAVYDRLGTTPAPTETTAQRNAASRARSRAVRNRWLPPEVWIDPDNPDEDPTDVAVELDEVVVIRILGGDWRTPATRPERIEVVARWLAAGRPISQLERATGWRADRYYEHDTEVA